jgi:ankyrin repeat protein
MAHPTAWIVRIVASVVFFSSLSCFAEIETQTAFSSEMLLQNAIKGGQLDDVRLLLENGMDVNKSFNDGVTPLHVAIINNQENIAAMLLQAGAKVDAPDSTTLATPLHMAALYGRVGIAELLIKKNADVNAVMKFDITPLQVATQFNQPQIVEILINNKADINHVDQEGFTALHFAAQNGDETIARLLIDHRAKVNVRDKTKKATPLNIAVENNHPTIAHLLAQHGGK